MWRFSAENREKSYKRSTIVSRGQAKIKAKISVFESILVKYLYIVVLLTTAACRKEFP